MMGELCAAGVTDRGYNLEGLDKSDDVWASLHVVG